MAAVLKSTLDFIIIGTQKGGTTTLFKLLVDHPRIFMPAEKELPLFNRDDRLADGWQNVIRRHFGNAPPQRLWGKASPQYMADPRVPERLAAALPAARLIAILRNPIERALSHHAMMVRRGLERRGFAEAVQALLGPEAAARARALPASIAMEDQCYLAWGEYGRILAAFLERFPREQLLILFTEDLERTPERVLDAVLSFMSLEPGYRPPSLGKRYHVGGSRERLPWIKPLLRATPLRHLWRRVPERYRSAAGFWFAQVNAAGDRAGSPALSPELRRRLAEFFRDDVRRVEQTFHLRVPWPEFA